MKATVYVGVSVDGYIARADGGLDWLEAGGGAAGEDYGFAEFFASVDVLVVGRNTYEKVRTFGGWPYGDKPVVVLTSRDIEIPPEIQGTVEAMAGAPHEILQRLAERGASHVYVDGGRTAQQFLAAGLIQRLVLTRIPVLIGSGIPLFGPVPHDVKLRHVSTRAYDSGLVQTEYEVVASAGQDTPALSAPAEPPEAG